MTRTTTTFSRHPDERLPASLQNTSRKWHFDLLLRRFADPCLSNIFSWPTRRPPLSPPVVFRAPSFHFHVKGSRTVGSSTDCKKGDRKSETKLQRVTVTVEIVKHVSPRMDVSRHRLKGATTQYTRVLSRITHLVRAKGASLLYSTDESRRCSKEIYSIIWQEFELNIYVHIQGKERQTTRASPKLLRIGYQPFACWLHCRYRQLPLSLG